MILKFAMRVGRERCELRTNAKGRMLDRAALGEIA
jgi:hypothetical protein